MRVHGNQIVIFLILAQLDITDLSLASIMLRLGHSYVEFKGVNPGARYTTYPDLAG